MQNWGTVVLGPLSVPRSELSAFKWSLMSQLDPTTTHDWILFVSHPTLSLPLSILVFESCFLGQ